RIAALSRGRKTGTKQFAHPRANCAAVSVPDDGRILETRQTAAGPHRAGLFRARRGSWVTRRRGAARAGDHAWENAAVFTHKRAGSRLAPDQEIRGQGARA